MVVSEPFQAFLGAGEAIPAVGKRDAIAPRRRARQPGKAWYGTVAVLDENGTRTTILQTLLTKYYSRLDNKLAPVSTSWTSCSRMITAGV
jgi:hypothetical protein